MGNDVAVIKAQLAAKRQELDEAQNAASQARNHHGRLRGLRALDEASPAEVAEAGAQVTAAEDDAQALADGVEILEERLRQAEQAEQEQRREQARADVANAAKAEQAANKRIERALASARAGLEAKAAARLARQNARSLVVEMRDPEAEEEALRQRYRDIRAELLRTVPPGMEVDEHSLDVRYESDQEALHARIAAEADAFAGEEDATAFAEMRDGFADLVPHLIDTPTANALRGGREFTQRPMAAGTMGSVTTGYVGRLYGSGMEFEEAERRHREFNAALDRLVGQGLTIAQEAQRRNVAAGQRA